MRVWWDSRSTGISGTYVQGGAGDQQAQARVCVQQPAREEAQKVGIQAAFLRLHKCEKKRGQLVEGRKT